MATKVKKNSGKITKKSGETRWTPWCLSYMKQIFLFLVMLNDIRSCFFRFWAFYCTTANIELMASTLPLM